MTPDSTSPASEAVEAAARIADEEADECRVTIDLATTDEQKDRCQARYRTALRIAQNIRALTSPPPQPAPPADARENAVDKLDDNSVLVAQRPLSPNGLDAREIAMDGLQWLATRENLELHHYSPMRCDDDDDAVEWRVTQVSGSINDREWDIVGKGPTPFAALLSARATLSRQPVSPPERRPAADLETAARAACVELDIPADGWDGDEGDGVYAWQAEARFIRAAFAAIGITFEEPPTSASPHS